MSTFRALLLLLVLAPAAAVAQELTVKESAIKVLPVPKPKDGAVPPVPKIQVKLRTIAQGIRPQDVKLTVAENGDMGYDGGDTVATALIPYSKMGEESLHVVILVEGTYTFMGNDQ